MDFGVPFDSGGVKCLCSDGKGANCVDETCWTSRGGMCFHFMEAVRDANEKFLRDDLGSVLSKHVFGCVAEEAENNRAALQCHGHLVPHLTPKTIACCNDYDLCNDGLIQRRNLSFLHRFTDDEFADYSPVSWWLMFGLLGMVVLIALVLIIGGCICCYFRCRRKSNQKTKYFSLLARIPLLKSEKFGHEQYPSRKSDEALGLCDTSSGSGSKGPYLVARTVANELDRKHSVGKGRYGEVFLADCRGDRVAVKQFFTTEEAAWANEKDIYETPLIHTNILRFIAADISSQYSVTQMLIVTEYCQFGSLYDYLKRDSLTLRLQEALQLAQSICAGLEYLHHPLRGTQDNQCQGSGKPAIAHRDIKSKNILVQDPGVCVIADFGLAVKDSGKPTGVRNDRRVGTKRYMAPEVLDGRINCLNIEALKQADMYSLALVLWEVTRRVQEDEPASKVELVEEDETRRESPLATRVVSDDSGVLSGSFGSGGTTGGLSSDHPSAPPSLPHSVLRFCPKEYLCPFGDLVSNDPSFDEMKQIVCVEEKRPPIEKHWLVPGSTLNEMATLMKECWSPIPEARLTALKVKNSLKLKLKGKARADVVSALSHSKSYNNAETAPA